jgi:hypothetical protein
MASALAPAVVGSALLDLKGSSYREHLPSSNVVKASGVSNGSQGINSRKRKEAGGLPGDHSINDLAEVTNNEGGGRAPTAVQVAALQALEALLNTVSLCHASCNSPFLLSDTLEKKQTLLKSM